MKRTGIRDVAKAAGVSITTVSRALNGYSDVSAETKERILQIANEMNYVPNANARSLGGIATKTMAYLVSGLNKVDESGIVYGIMSGMYHVAAQHHYEFIILTTDAMRQGEMNYVQLCRQKNIDGVLVFGLNTHDPYYSEVVNSEIPCVVVDSDYRNGSVCALSVNNEKASYEAVAYLIENGHKNIGMMSGKVSAFVSKQRLEGYLKALRRHELEIKDDYIGDGNFLREDARKETLKILKMHPEITAFFAASDVMAMGIIDAAKELNLRVPEDLSVIGFDDIPVAQYVAGGLTTIAQMPFEMGCKGALALHDMIEGSRDYGHIYMDYKFIKRNTVQDIRKQSQ